MPKQLTLLHSAFLASEAETLGYGAGMTQWCKAGVSVHLHGQLGAGKTTLVRGLLRAFGFKGHVKSPTYTLVEAYDLDAFTLYHFDFYRLEDPEELEWMGIRDYFREDSLCMIEWAERGKGWIPHPHSCIELLPEDDGRRINVLSSAQCSDEP